MNWINIDSKLKDKYNLVVNHPLQSYEWGEFRTKTGVKVIRKGLLKDGNLVDGFTLTIHKIPKLKYNIGYLPKGNAPTKEVISQLIKIGKENLCIFIQIEPNITDKRLTISNKFLKNSFHPLFTKYTFILDLNKSEEDLLKSFHSKTRYNIKVAQKHNVKILEDNSSKSFSQYLQLTKQTTDRQKFYAHTPSYHKKMWETLRTTNSKLNHNALTAHLLTAKYLNKVLVAWIVFVFKDKLYYPYGASSAEFRNVMASNLMMWETIKFGKKEGLKSFDMWGSLGQNPDKNDPWYGFHKFKEGYSPTLTEFAGSYDLIINPFLYQFYKILDKGRWLYLRLLKKIQS